MTEARCGNCGGEILQHPGQVSVATALTCPHCAPGGPSGSSAALDPYRTGIIVLEGELKIEPAPAVEVKVKGFLTQEGLSPDEADFRLRGGLTVVGRQEGQIVIDDPAVSSRHFQIEERDGRFVVRDLGSSNGTFLNDSMVRSAQLQSGDRIQAGSTRFIFSVRHSIPT